MCYRKIENSHDFAKVSKIVYKELPDGAEITYSTHIEKLKLAIHRWFDAQLSDHARHAMPGHSHDSSHHH